MKPKLLGSPGTKTETLACDLQPCTGIRQLRSDSEHKTGVGPFHNAIVFSDFLLCFFRWAMWLYWLIHCLNARVESKIRDAVGKRIDDYHAIPFSHCLLISISKKRYLDWKTQPTPVHRRHPSSFDIFVLPTLICAHRIPISW